MGSLSEPQFELFPISVSVVFHRENPCYVNIALQFLTTVPAEPTHVHSLSDVRLLTALFDWNLFVDEFAAVRAVTNWWF